MNPKMHKIFFAAATAVILVSGCGKDKPPKTQEQVNLEKEFDEMKAILEKGRKADNWVFTNQATDRYRKWKNSIGRVGDNGVLLARMNDFICEYKKANINGRVECEEKQFTFRINLAKADEKLILELKKGDYISFSGGVFGEESFSAAGAIEKPEIVIYDAIISKK